MNNARSVTLQLGGEWRGNYGSAPCPICQPERRADQRALAVREAAGILLIYCHKAGCGFHDICRRLDLPCSASISPVQVHRLVKDKRELQVTAQLQRARLLWRQSVSINGSMAESYLRARGITCSLPPTLRWHPDLHHGPSGVRLSAMVSLVEPTSAVHRTFFNSDGSRVKKAPKMMLGTCAGGTVCLSKDKGPLVVAEGIETGLSLLCGILGYPATVWAALSTSGMKSLILPAKPSDLIIASDGDDAGRRAAEALARRASSLGWQVMLKPAPRGQDWNDVLKASMVHHGQ